MATLGQNLSSDVLEGGVRTVVAQWKHSGFSASFPGFDSHSVFPSPDLSSCSASLADSGNLSNPSNMKQGTLQIQFGAKYKASSTKKFTEEIFSLFSLTLFIVAFRQC